MKKRRKVMDNIENIDIDWEDTPLNEDKLKENFNNLKNSFPDIHFNYGCDWCTKETRDKREGYCKNCMLWQESPPVEDSLESRYTWGNICIYDNNGKSFCFRNTSIKLDITSKVEGIDYFRKVDIFKLSDISMSELNSKKYKNSIHIEADIELPKTISIHKLGFFTNEVIFTPKESLTGKMICNSLEELVKYYNIYRSIPETISAHNKHNKNYMNGNYYIKLELLK